MQVEIDLLDIEKEHNVSILYACEAGSRAWGFPSPDSDWDVRFIYARDWQWYLSYDVEHRRDVIEKKITGDLDINGWDIRKALYLFTRTNGALLEWLSSPIIYMERGLLTPALKRLAPQCFNSMALCYHYSHMARRNAREYLWDRNEVRLKKYLYVVRPLLAIRWIEKNQTPPPVIFNELIDDVCPPEIRDDLSRLLKLKTETPELGMGPPFFGLNEFVTAEIQRHDQAFKGQGRPIMDSQELRNELNKLFVSSIFQSDPVFQAITQAAAKLSIATP